MPTSVSKRAIWEYLNGGGKEHDTYAEFVEANEPANTDHLTEEVFALLKTVSLRELVADQYMGENSPGGDDIIEYVRMAQGAIEDGYKLATWYGPQMQTLIVGYNPAELDPVEDDEDDTDELHRHGIYEEN